MPFGVSPKSDASADPDAVLRQYRRRWWGRVGQAGLLVVGVAISFGLVGLLDGDRLVQGIPAVVDLLVEMLPPDFGRWRQWLLPLAQTLAMSVAGTALALGLAAPMALLAARTTTPHPLVFYGARLVLNLARAVPELILGMVLVVAVGFGTLPGTLALGIHSVGMVGKFLAEAIERSDTAPIEAARAVGASPPQVIVHGILPQIWPQVVDLTCYRWEYNFRASLVLGAVGAGGIGLEIISALRVLDYPQVSALLVVVLALVTVVDSLSSALRRRVMA